MANLEEKLAEDYNNKISEQRTQLNKIIFEVKETARKSNNNMKADYEYLNEDLRRDVDINNKDYKKEMKVANKFIEELQKNRTEDLKLFREAFVLKEDFTKQFDDVKTQMRMTDDLNFDKSKHLNERVDSKII